MSKNNLYHYRAAIDRVIDGDTIDVTLDLGFDINMHARVRFAGINAPESRTKDLVEKQKGLDAKRFVEDWISGSETIIVQTKLDGKGKFGRVLGNILNADGACLNDEMIALGHATPYEGGKR
jgi:micrococcal nuclease